LLLQFTNYQRLLGGFFYFRGYDKVELKLKMNKSANSFNQRLEGSAGQA
jgi:hypothetical protein